LTVAGNDISSGKWEYRLAKSRTIGGNIIDFIFQNCTWLVSRAKNPARNVIYVWGHISFQNGSKQVKA
jgi:hypothetical protein